MEMRVRRILSNMPEEEKKSKEEEFKTRYTQAKTNRCVTRVIENLRTQAKKAAAKAASSAP